MSSLFRRPGEDSSSDEDDGTSSQDQGDEDIDASSDGQTHLTRVHTLLSTGSEPPSPSPLAVGSAGPGNNGDVANLLLHSLLEEKVRREAAQALGKSEDDPEVQEVSKQNYQLVSRELSRQMGIDQTCAGDGMQQRRAAAQLSMNDAMQKLMSSQLSNTDALITRPSVGNWNMDTSPINTLLNAMPAQLLPPLHNQPGLDAGRYQRDFVQLRSVGKGGYGKVYEVQNRVDNSHYALKRVPVSSVQWQNVQRLGQRALDRVLHEVRALARLDHTNITRYYQTWFEFDNPHAAPIPQMDTLPSMNWLIEGAKSHTSEPSFGPAGIDASEEGPDIVFEDSQPGTDVSHGLPSELLAPTQIRNRRASRATIATVSSTRSKMSSIESVGEHQDELEAASREESSDIESNMVSQSDVAGQLVHMRSEGPVLMLNIQMALYQSNLHAFLNGESIVTASEAHSEIAHCFHPCISLEIISKVLDGIQYLHSVGQIHRDLKPANIFLAVSGAAIPPGGSVDLTSCGHCPGRTAMPPCHVNPRIGDFGLVAALGEPTSKLVGTEFYRPVLAGTVDGKLDVFALGVVLFELVWKFGTRMERIDTLIKLKAGELPSGFAEKMGVCGDQLSELVLGMVANSEAKRFNLDEVRTKVDELIASLRV